MDATMIILKQVAAVLDVLVRSVPIMTAVLIRGHALPMSAVTLAVSRLGAVVGSARMA